MARNDDIKLAVIYGSIRETRLAETVGVWARGEIWNDDRFTAETIDPADLSVTAWHGDMQESDLRTLRATLDWADGFVVVTPEYNHGVPAVLKSLIDAAGKEWAGKPVAFVSYGGLAGGLRSVEQLRLIFAELSAHTVRDTVSFAMPWGRFAEDGTLSDPEAAQKAMRQMLSGLHWWASALRVARRVDARPESAA